MAASGTYAFNPQLADHIDEAFENCGISPSDLTARHIRSAVRSANLMLTDWQNWGHKQFTMKFVSEPFTSVGQDSFILPLGGFDIFHATLKRDNFESEMYPISRSDYNALHDKTLLGRPDRYFVDRGTFVNDNQQSTVFMYHKPENTTDTMEIWYLARHEDAGAPSNTLAMSPNYNYAFSCGMSFMLSKKFAPERSQKLRDEYIGKNFDEYKNSNPGGAFGRALAEDRDTGDATLRVRFDRSRGRR